MQHAFLRRNGGTPLLRHRITALLESVTELESEELTVAQFALYIQTSHPCTRSVGTGKEDVSRGIQTVLAEEEDVLQISIEALRREVHLQPAELTVPIGTESRRM